MSEFQRMSPWSHSNGPTSGRFWNVSSFSQICNLLHFQRCTICCFTNLPSILFSWMCRGSSSYFNVSFWRILRLCRRWQNAFFLNFVIVQRMSNAEYHKMFSCRSLKIAFLRMHLSSFGDLVEKSIFSDRNQELKASQQNASVDFTRMPMLISLECCIRFNNITQF